MIPNSPKTSPAVAKTKRAASAARSMRQAHSHLLQVLRNTQMNRFRVKALVTNIEHCGGQLFIGLFQPSRDEEKHWVLTARVHEPVREALEHAIGGAFGQPYLAADIIADIELGMTDQFMLTATITRIIEIRPHRGL
jgi:hypothetical protein